MKAGYILCVICKHHYAKKSMINRWLLKNVSKLFFKYCQKYRKTKSKKNIWYNKLPYIDWKIECSNKVVLFWFENCIVTEMCHQELNNCNRTWYTVEWSGGNLQKAQSHDMILVKIIQATEILGIDYLHCLCHMRMAEGLYRLTSWSYFHHGEIFEQKCIFVIGLVSCLSYMLLK